MAWSPSELKGNIRDYASINELICLANMENINAVLIDEGVPQGDRLVRLNQIAINQMRVLENDDNRNLLKWYEWIGHQICAAIRKHKSKVYVTKRWHVLAIINKNIPFTLYKRM